MSYSERIYIQNANCCVRNQDLLNIRTSGDFCEFNPPFYDISGATKIQPLSATSEGVYMLTDENSIDLKIIFSGGPSYSGETVKAFVDFYKYDLKNNIFSRSSIYQVEEIPLSAISTTSAYTITVPTNIITPDNEYLIKTYFEFDACTEFLNILDVRYNNQNLNGNQYGIYDSNFDYYISVSNVADTPIFSVSSVMTNSIQGNLVAYSIFPTNDGQTNFVLQNYAGHVMVNLNGITLAPTYEYIISGNILTISAGTKTTDVITLVHVLGSTSTQGLNHDFIKVSTIISGSTGGQGTNNVYYNTDYNKYEIYTSVNIAPNNDVIVILNGVTLANNIDYYKSISNDKRIILNGTILPNDIINIYYFSNVTYVGSIYTNTPTVSWRIDHAPTLVNGKFTLEVSTASTFTTLTYSSATQYIVGNTNYTDNMIISGTVGTMYYYRVKNEKFYQPITGNTLNSIAYSEIIPVMVQTNSINSY